MILELNQIHKSFATGFLLRKKPVLRDLSLQLEAGDCYAILGANGAGKSTMLRILLGLSTPDSGTGSIMGRPLADRRAHEKLGYLPENPSFHEQLSAVEFLTYCGQLIGMRGAPLVRRIDDLLQRVQLEEARNRRLRKMSKGMLQRIGLCQALLGDPELLILDEPMSGLDPPGRKVVRDLILEQRDAGKTVLFSTHILSDAEVVCTRAGILRNGTVASELRLRDLNEAASQRMEVVLRDVEGEQLRRLSTRAKAVVRGRGTVMFQVTSGTALNEFLRQALSMGITIQSVAVSHVSLEDVFVQLIQSSETLATPSVSECSSSEAEEFTVGSL